MVLTDNDLSKIGQVVEARFEPVKKNLRKVNKTLTSAIKLFDEDYRTLTKRVEKVETKVGIPPPLF